MENDRIPPTIYMPSTTRLWPQCPHDFTQAHAAFGRISKNHHEQAVQALEKFHSGTWNIQTSRKGFSDTAADTLQPTKRGIWRYGLFSRYCANGMS
jgi:hypothetical protein